MKDFITIFLGLSIGVGGFMAGRNYGEKTFREIFDLVRADDTLKGPPPGDEELFADFAPVYEIFNAIDRLLLRHESAQPSMRV